MRGNSASRFFLLELVEALFSGMVHRLCWFGFQSVGGNPPLTRSHGVAPTSPPFAGWPRAKHCRVYMRFCASVLLAVRHMLAPRPLLRLSCLRSRSVFSSGSVGVLSVNVRARHSARQNVGCSPVHTPPRTARLCTVAGESVAVSFFLTWTTEKSVSVPERIRTRRIKLNTLNTLNT